MSACSACGCDVAQPVGISPGEDGVVIAHRRPHVALGSMCFACLDEAQRGFEQLKDRFEHMIAEGVERAAANAVLCDWIARGTEDLAELDVAVAAAIGSAP